MCLTKGLSSMKCQDRIKYLNSFFIKIVFYTMIIMPIYSQSECDGERYIDEIFNQVDITAG